MTGKGIDRHLFALYVVSQGMGVDSAFPEAGPQHGVAVRIIVVSLCLLPAFSPNSSLPATCYLSMLDSRPASSLRAKPVAGTPAEAKRTPPESRLEVALPSQRQRLRDLLHDCWGKQARLPHFLQEICSPDRLRQVWPRGLGLPG